MSHSILSLCPVLARISMSPEKEDIRQPSKHHYSLMWSAGMVQRWSPSIDYMRRSKTRSSKQAAAEKEWGEQIKHHYHHLRFREHHNNRSVGLSKGFIFGLETEWEATRSLERGIQVGIWEYDDDNMDETKIWIALIVYFTYPWYLYYYYVFYSFSRVERG